MGNKSILRLYKGFYEERKDVNGISIGKSISDEEINEHLSRISHIGDTIQIARAGHSYGAAYEHLKKNSHLNTTYDDIEDDCHYCTSWQIGNILYRAFR